MKYINKMMKFVYVLINSLLFTSEAVIPGKFCTSIFGNPLNVSLDTNTVNVSATVFGESVICNNDPYKLVNNSILLEKNQSNCLNTYLKTHDMCPCPPEITYKNTSLSIMGTPLGSINLKAC